MAHVVVVGDSMLDRQWSGEAERLCPDTAAPVILQEGDHARPGGAALAALFAAELGAATTLITALGADRAGAELAVLLTSRGIDVIDLGLQGRTPEKIRLLATGATVARLDRNCRDISPVGRWSARADAALTQADGVLAADYGRHLCVSPAARAALSRAGRTVPVLWDPHPSSGSPPAGLDLYTPNLAEACALAGKPRVHEAAAATPLAARLSERWRAAVAVTTGGEGAVLAEPGTAPEPLTTTCVAGDPCGAGDRLAAATAVARAAGASRRGALVAGIASAREWVLGSTPTPRWLPRHRSSGDTLVAAGGCFDLLHAGHVRLLQAARAMGDELVVCLNSDRSVRRLKGSGRPVNSEEDRAAVLLGLGCVDRVEVFDEDTPCALLERLRPQLFVKGADYEGTDLPEREVLAAWGGRLVLVDLLDGHSTTRMLARASELASA